MRKGTGEGGMLAAFASSSAVRLIPTPFTSSSAHLPHPHHIASSPRSPSLGALGWIRHRWVHIAVVGLALPWVASIHRRWVGIVPVGLESCPLGWNRRQWVEFAVVGLNLLCLGSQSLSFGWIHPRRTPFSLIGSLTVFNPSRRCWVALRGRRESVRWKEKE
jgi:hypothetical protein